ncbi:MAG: gliding motility lipoprotein GldH [Chitinophagales bacterium]|nr:gliding motility lipoprotein GldH [Chitinophagales bacterium]
MTNRIWFIFAVVIFLFSCNEGSLYEKNMDIEKGLWQITDTLKFEPKIQDNLPKNLYVNIRHTSAFNWRNLWLNLQIVFPNDSVVNEKINIQLSQPNGQWYGKCSGDVCLIQIPVENYEQYSFTDTGVYTFALSHEMRENPLENILSMGIKIEDIKEE